MNVERDLARFNWDGEPVRPRLAATVVCARPAGDGYEILLVRRPKGARFAGDAFVFPGGKVDAADASPEPPPEVSGPLAELPLERRSAVWRAALRELYEETGVLFAEPAPTEAPPRDDAAGFWRILRAADARPRLERLHYWVNWVTPKPLPVRFDTHFFLAILPAGVEVALPPGELVEARWFTPAAAIAAYAASEIELMFPTFKSLEQLAGVPRIEDLVPFVSAFPKLRVEPRLDPGGGGPILALPEAWPAPRTP